MSKVLLIDGNALLYRAYHAFPKELTTPKGEPVGAVYGFTRILLSTIKTLKPTAIGVCFDLKGATFRHEAYQEYKATRQKMPDDLASQIERTHELVKALEFPIYTSQGYEADDVIGTLAKQATTGHKDCEVIIVTGDQDLIQLVNAKISVYSPSTPPKQPTLYTPEKVLEKYGFRPDQMVEYKALRGDPSDNIPGVPGIGEVTATKLLQEFETIEKLYQALENGTAETLKPTLREKLLENKPSAQMSHELSTIHTDVPVTFDPDLCELQLKAPENLINLFQELGFKSLLRELPNSHTLLSTAADVFSDPEHAEPSSEPDSQSEKIDRQLAPILRAMEKTGVKVDVPYLQKLEAEFTAELEKMKAKLWELAGEEFNPDSPQQVSRVFYEKLVIPTGNIRKGKNGYTTDAATLQELAKEYPIAGLLLQYRELMKLLTTYVRPLQELVDEQSRVHTSYAPDTSTGRISSRNPNLQNIPIRSEQGRRLRQAFIADLGKILLAADYSQIELRIAAHLSDDPVMKEVFSHDGDFHAETAARMNVDRRVAKIINFSILYGKGAFGFAQDMGISVPEARAYIDQYFAAFQKLRTYLDSLLVSAKTQGYLETMLGRRRYFPDLKSSNFRLRAAAEREAVNLPIQGTAADILKMAMCNAADQWNPKWGDLILTVHDELVAEIDPAYTQEAAQLLSDTMTQAVKLSVPLQVHLKTGTNWAEMNDLVLAK